MQAETLKQLRSERDRFVAFSFAGADLLIELDEAGRVGYAAGAARRLTGLESTELCGRPLKDVVIAEDRSLLTALLGRLSIAGTRCDPVLIRLSGGPSAQSPTFVLLSGCKLPGMGAAWYLALSEARPALTTPSPADHHDETGLLKSEPFERRAVESLRIARELGIDLGLTMIELRNLDMLSDRMGKDRSEALLREVSGTLRAASMGGSTAGRLDHSRFGVLHDLSISRASIEADVETVTRRSDPTHLVQAEARSLDFPISSLTAEEAANALSYAITTFAEGGAAAFSLSSPEETLKALVADTVARVSTFKSTVADSRFELVYQPIVSLASRKLHHYEALTRFEGGASPFETIRFAEGVSLIGEFDLAVCQRALDQIQVASNAGARAMIAVNISGRSIASDLFVATLRAMLARHPLLRRDLMFEITESTQIHDLVRAGNVVRKLREEGHSVSLDDFGAGAASFPYLQALYVDFVKIDGLYVRKSPMSKTDRAIVNSITSLCRELDIATIAEMVELEEQAVSLTAMGVGYGQGWLFGHPGPLPIERMLPPSPPPPPPIRRAARRQGEVQRWE